MVSPGERSGGGSGGDGDGDGGGLTVAGMETSSERADSAPEFEIMHSPIPLTSLPLDWLRRFARVRLLRAFAVFPVPCHLGPKSEEFDIKFF